MKLILPIALSALIFPMPLVAADKLNIPVEVAPCTIVTLPNGTKMCVPPKVAKNDCIKVTVKEEGKPDKTIWICDKPRDKKPETPKPATTPKPAGGY
jgi:hypothetical protein